MSVVRAGREERSKVEVLGAGRSEQLGQGGLWRLCPSPQHVFAPQARGDTSALKSSPFPPREICDLGQVRASLSTSMFKSVK